ncbi:MAG TPA: peptide deformylase [Syntrophobacteraceae bacterium]|nr:peptide deformylase [Syntrophobacteraceae bacterium]
MALLSIVTYPEEPLRSQTAPVEKIDHQIRKLITDMVETMYDAPGIGLAANQVGQLLQVVVIDLQREEQRGLITLVNPRIVAAQGQVSFEEGCLSVPGYFAHVSRHEQVTVEALDVDGKPLLIEASGLLAVVLQHELDHLHGRLFIDHLNPIARDIFKRRWKKKRKQAEG